MSQDYNSFSQDDFVDISSSSGYGSKHGSRKKMPIEKYGKGIFKNLGVIIKFIAFLICFMIIAVSFVAAYFVFSFNSVFITISFAIVLVGTVTAIITLFLIYGLGHVICQNNEILTRLKRH